MERRRVVEAVYPALLEAGASGHDERLLHHAVAASAEQYSSHVLAAAVVAGWQIVVSAVQALRIKMISIDLLVIVAAIGALFINNYWESAAVTFLFALGKALEKATMNRTRKALSDLAEADAELL